MGYYAVFGADGVAVYNDWKKVEIARNYISQVNTKKFHTFREAVNYAVSQYNILADDDFGGPIPENFVLHREQIELIKQAQISETVRLFKDYCKEDGKIKIYYLSEGKKQYIEG